MSPFERTTCPVRIAEPVADVDLELVRLHATSPLPTSSSGSASASRGAKDVVSSTRLATSATWMAVRSP